MRYAAAVEYDGSAYAGWQRQGHCASVQAVVEAALGSVAAQTISVVCAGRTDTGVHATAQYIHFETSAERGVDNWLRGTNSRLPDDVVLQWVRPVAEDFHARFSALARRYFYVICNRRVRPALLRQRVTWYQWPLSAERMHEAGQSLLGERDFSSYRAVACQSPTPMRRVDHVRVTQIGDFVVIDIQANAFLHHMVRNIAGVLLAIGAGQRPVSWAGDLLLQRDRTLGGVTAPPTGLYLVDVIYPERFQLPGGCRLPDWLANLGA